MLVTSMMKKKRREYSIEIGGRVLEHIESYNYLRTIIDENYTIYRDIIEQESEEEYIIPWE